VGDNQEKINEKVLVRDEVARLKRESEMNMEAAEKLREQARPIYDDIERADYYRQAYALEALAIDQQRQIQTICNNLEVLNQYNEADLAILKTGTVPASQKKDSATDVEITAQTPAETTNLNAAFENNNADVVAAAQAEMKSTSETKVDTGASSTTVNATAETTGYANTNQSSEAVTDFARAEATVPASANNASAADNQLNDVSATEVKATEGTETTTTEPASAPAQIYTTRAENINTERTRQLTEEVQTVKVSEEVDGQKYDDGQVITTETVLTVTVPEATLGTPAAVQPATPAEAKASANAADYYYSMPSEVVADLFAMTARGVYSDSRPIPIDMEMPKGVYYKVQIGAFRNDIPQNLYDQFAPISGERLNSGITRYTAGFFVQFDNAKQVKQQIRAMGYNDAFIVAYRDGKRIPLYEAAAITDGPELAASIKAAFEKAAVGSVAQNTSTAATGNTAANADRATVNNASAVNAAASANTVANNQSVAPSNSSGVSSTATPSNSTAINTTANNNNVQSAASNGNLNIDAEVAAELARKPVTRTVEEIEAAAAVPKNTEYYKADQETVAKAQQVEAVKGLFFTIQVGVYSKPVAAALLQNVNPLNSELTETNKIRYTSGQFNNMADAVVKRDEVRKIGIADAFVTAYYNGKRITLSEADLLLKEKGAGVLAK
jgi:hypothetical protein